MSIASKFFFEDKCGNIRVNINEEVFDIITDANNKDSEEMMLILLTELFKEINELTTELEDKEVSKKTQELLRVISHNHTLYVINQSRVIKRIEELEKV